MAKALVALVGGDEFRPACRPMDAALLRLTRKRRPVVAIVPTAAAHERPELAARNGVSYFQALGADAAAAMATDARSADDPSVLAPLNEADLVYLTGGNPSHLLEALSTTRLWAAICKARDRGAFIVGSSAGAMVLGAVMAGPDGDGWRDALGLVPRIAVLPHFERWSQARRDAAIAARPPGVVLLGIPAATALAGEPDATSDWHVVGAHPVSVIDEDGVRTISPGERVGWPSGGG